VRWLGPNCVGLSGDTPVADIDIVAAGAGDARSVGPQRGESGGGVFGAVIIRQREDSPSRRSEKKQSKKLTFSWIRFEKPQGFHGISRSVTL
jgi:hypothetical protein